MMETFLELKKDYAPLNTRKRQATEYGCMESEVASKIKGCNPIPIPHGDMLGFVLYFVCECPPQDWIDFKCPYSLFMKKQVSPLMRERIEDYEILGEDVAIIAYSLMRWFGSQNIFNIIREKWRFNFQDSCLERK